MIGSPTRQTMMRAISPDHMTRCMWTTNQAVHAWTHPNSSRNYKQAPLMTWQVKVSGHDSHVMKATALLDSALSTSFVTELLVLLLQLPHQRKHFQVAGFGGKVHKVSYSMVSFHVAYSNNACTSSGHLRRAEATVLPNVTTKLPTLPVPFSAKWKHLQGLQMDDQWFGVLDSFDILLGADILTHVMLQGRRRCPPGSPTALQTQFGWVLMGVQWNLANLNLWNADTSF